MKPRRSRRQRKTETSRRRGTTGIVDRLALVRFPAARNGGIAQSHESLRT